MKRIKRRELPRRTPTLRVWIPDTREEIESDGKTATSWRLPLPREKQDAPDAPRLIVFLAIEIAVKSAVQTLMQLGWPEHHSKMSIVRWIAKSIDVPYIDADPGDVISVVPSTTKPLGH